MRLGFAGRRAVDYALIWADHQRPSLFLGAPVALGVGICLYFAASLEAPIWAYGAGLLACLALYGVLGRVRSGGAMRLVCLGLAWAVLGMGLGAIRTAHMAAPVLEFRYFGPIEGRIVDIDRSASHALRLSLDQVILANVAPADMPRYVRVSIHEGATRGTPLRVGDVVMMTGHLAPPSGPTEPGSYDFARQAYFAQIGAVGYTRLPVVLAQARPEGAFYLADLRLRLSAAIQAQMSPRAGGMAAALMTGDRSGIYPEDNEAMIAANIYHLISISGLHMGLLTGLVFMGLRMGFALIPRVALCYPTQKWAALAALAVGAFYLALAGGDVATERAYIQVAVMFAAVLVDRRAVTLRSVAIAALIVMARRPETVLSPGFQMSFAATAGLVAVYGQIGTGRWSGKGLIWPLRVVYGVILTSIIAGAMTAPFAALHFNRLTSYGLIANLIAVPLTGAVVMPMAVASALLAPLGLSWLAFWPMEQALLVILASATEIATWPHATRAVVAPEGLAIFAVVFALIALIALRGALARVAAMAILAFGLIQWHASPRPDILISASGRLVGVMTPQGRALSHPRGDGFVARLWLENDGDPVLQEEAAARPAWRADGSGAQWAEIAGLRLWHARNVEDAGIIARACAAHDLVIVPSARLDKAARVDAQGRIAWPMAECLILDATSLRRSGPVAITLPQGQASPPILRVAAQDHAMRPWRAR